jgi:hypothetical protein
MIMYEVNLNHLTRYKITWGSTAKPLFSSSNLDAASSYSKHLGYMPAFKSCEKSLANIPNKGSIIPDFLPQGFTRHRNHLLYTGRLARKFFATYASIASAGNSAAKEATCGG